MQTGVGSLNLAQVVGCLVAWALVLGSFWGLFWLKKRRREERNERPPQREKLPQKECGLGAGVSGRVRAEGPGGPAGDSRARLTPFTFKDQFQSGVTVDG